MNQDTKKGRLKLLNKIQDSKIKINDKLTERKLILLHNLKNKKLILDNKKNIIKYKLKEKKQKFLEKVKKRKTDMKLFYYGLYLASSRYAISTLAYFYVIFHFRSGYYMTLGITIYLLSWILLIIGLYIAGKSYLFKKIILILFGNKEVKKYGYRARING